MIKLASNLVLPPSATTETFAILARKDGGKTYCGLKSFEEMHAEGAQCVSIDPVGKWWSLRLAADGKSAGIDLPIFGGLYGDLPLEATAGALIARVIVERGISAVVDVSLFEDRDMKRFVTDFARELYRLKQRDQSVMHLFVEEASTFCPQDKEDGNDPPMLSAMKKLVRKGRNYGVGVTMIDQRAQDVNKKVLNQTSILIVLGTSGTTDRTAIEKWVRDKHIDVSGLDELASLPQGDAFVWLPREKTFKRVHIAERWTFDASATPKLGARKKERKLTPTDVAGLRAAMAESVERVEAEDPKALKKRIAELERQLVVRPVAKAAEKIVEVPVLKAEDLAPLLRAVDRMEGLNAEWDKIRDRAAQSQQVVVSTLGNIKTVLERRLVVQSPRRTPPARVAVQPIRPPREPRAAVSTEGVSGPQQRMLDALAWYEAFGILRPSRQALAIKLSLRVTGSFSNNLGALRTAGLIDYPNTGSVGLTAAGRTQATPPDMAPTDEAVQQAALEVVSGPQSKMLQALLKAYPNAISREEIAEVLDLQVTGSFNNNLGAMRTMGLIDYPQRGMVVATKLLFPGET